MKAMLLTAVSALVIMGLLLSACAPAAPVPSQGAPPSSPVPVPTLPGAVAPSPPLLTATPAPAAENPRYGGILFTSQAGDPPSFDVHQETTMRVQNMPAAAYSLLAQNDPLDETKLIGDLAEKWEVSPDGKVWTFSLHKGVKFHDGKPATSADVKATFQRIASPPKGTRSPRKDTLAAVEKMDTPDDYTVRFSLKFPQGSFLQMVANPYNMIFPRHILEAKGDMVKDVVGTGPFRFKEYIRGVSFDLERNPDYFVKGRPYLDGIKWYIIKDFAAVHSALRTGQVDLVIRGNQYLMGAEKKKVLKENPQLIEQTVAGTGFHMLFPNNQRKPWNDVRVRKALHLALDRKPLIDIPYQGDAQIMGYMLPGSWAIPTEELAKMPGYRQPKDEDIAEAKRLLAEAGYPKGLKTTVITRATMKAYVDAATIATENLSKVGIEATLTPLEDGTFWSRKFAGDFDLSSDGAAIAMADPDLLFGEHLVTGAAGNYGRYSNPKFDELFDRQMRTVDDKERKKLVLEMERIALADYPFLTYYAMKLNAFSWSHVKNYVFQGYYLGQKFQDVWLSK